METYEITFVNNRANTFPAGLLSADNPETIICTDDEIVVYSINERGDKERIEDVGGDVTVVVRVGNKADPDKGIEFQRDVIESASNNNKNLIGKFIGLLIGGTVKPQGCCGIYCGCC